jgi:hypothetical protein
MRERQREGDKENQSVVRSTPKMDEYTNMVQPTPQLGNSLK